jgi:hypothetical protein
MPTGNEASDEQNKQRESRRRSSAGAAYRIRDFAIDWRHDEKRQLMPDPDPDAPQGWMIGQPRVDLAEPRQVAVQKSIGQRRSLADIERLVDRQPRPLRKPRMIAAGIEGREDGKPGGQRNDRGPEPGRPK